jgi:hypothetical protein
MVRTSAEESASTAVPPALSRANDYSGSERGQAAPFDFPAELVGTPEAGPRGAGPFGKLRQVFESASKLPRHQQAKVAEFAAAFVAQQQKAG